MRRTLLGEGNTPCVEARRIAGELLFKLEQCNPTGSYKDRFIAREMERILETKATTVVATSSGNTGASLAAYCARFGLRCVICASPEAPPGKVMQMRAHGATVVRIPRFTVEAEVTAEVLETLQATGAPLVVSAFRFCPVGMAGVETIAEELEAIAPDHVFVPVGGGGLYSAVVRGFRGKRVKVHAVQPEGCPTVLEAVRGGLRSAVTVASRTAISGLSVPNDIDATLALTLLRENGGEAIGVSDGEVFAAQRRMLEEEGIYCEPAGATALAGYLKRKPEGRCVCLVTGHGFKDPGSIEAAAAQHASPVVGHRELQSFLSEYV